LKNIIKSQWIMANAGSGKTFALTERVVRLLLMGVPPERIICITYTKAAASEMRGRILARLRELLLADDAQCRALVQTYLGDAVTAEQLSRARALFASVLDSAGGGLQLTTIHGFCQSLLRRFPLEAGIAPHFTVLEDAAADELQARAKHSVLDIESVEEELQAALNCIGERGGEWHFEELSREIIAKRREWQELLRNHPPELLQSRIYAAHEVEKGATAESLAQAVSLGMGADSLAIMRGELPLLCSHKTEKYRHWGEVLAGWLEKNAPTTPVALAPLCKLFLNKEGEIKLSFNKAEFPEGSAFRVALEGLSASLARYQTQAASLACAEESFAVAVLAKALLTFYEAEKETIQALDYDDLIGRTLQLLSHPSMLGWVMQKLDHRIDHLLIDEAQDNSGEQWKMAHLLVEELMASNDGVGEGGLPRSVLVVGDEKQSIYSFQGAAPEQFARYREQFTALLKDSPASLQFDEKKKSYRSAQAVLTLVDAYCALPEVVPALSAQARGTTHVLHHEKAVGQATLYPPQCAVEKESNTPFTIPTEYHVTKSTAQVLATEIAHTIHHWLHTEQRVLKSEGRKLRAGDILILVHRRKPMVVPLLRALQSLDVAVAGIDRLTLSEHLAVRDMLALIQWVLNPADDLALAQVLRSPLVGMGDEELRQLAHKREGTLWQAVRNPWLEAMRAARHTTPYEFLAQVLEVDGKRKDFAQRFGNEVHEVLDEVLAQAAAMPAGMDATLANFHHWLSTSTRQIKREQEGGVADEVRIMTVHGAKGLEAPVVILADTVSVPTTQHERSFLLRIAEGYTLPVLGISEAAKRASLLARAKEEKNHRLSEEYKRLLYVALTRAKYELHLFGSANAKGEVKDGSWYDLSVRAMEAAGATKHENAVWVLADAPPETTDELKNESHKEATPLPEWAVQSVHAEVDVAATIAPSRLKPSEARPYAANAGRDVRERGVRIHRMLELLPAGADESLMLRLAAHVAPDWSDEARAKMVHEVARLYVQEAWLWQHPRQAEASIAGTISHTMQQIPVSGQVDLVVQMPEALVILDYKTGAYVPECAEDVPQNYLLQLKLYAALLQKIYPEKPIRCAILWTYTPKVMWLDAQVAAIAFEVAQASEKPTVAA
jgi:ATP-dependent helicase/nuclease subunit A